MNKRSEPENDLTHDEIREALGLPSLNPQPKKRPKRQRSQSDEVMTLDEIRATYDLPPLENKRPKPFHPVIERVWDAIVAVYDFIAYNIVIRLVRAIAVAIIFFIMVAITIMMIGILPILILGGLDRWIMGASILGGLAGVIVFIWALGQRVDK